MLGLTAIGSSFTGLPPSDALTFFRTQGAGVQLRGEAYPPSRGPLFGEEICPERSAMAMRGPLERGLVESDDCWLLPVYAELLRSNPGTAATISRRAITSRRDLFVAMPCERKT